FAGALFAGDHVAKVAATELAGGGRLAAWVTYHVDGGQAARGKPEAEDAPAARLEVRPVSTGSPSLASVGKPVLVSQKALSSGGVSLAVSPPSVSKAPEAVLAWVAKERGESQVF